MRDFSKKTLDRLNAIRKDDSSAPSVRAVSLPRILEEPKQELNWMSTVFSADATGHVNLANDE